MPIPVIDYLPDDRENFTAVCGFCGFPLTKYHISVDFAGQYISYDDHETGPFSFCLCKDCFEKLKEIVNGGVDGAYHRVYIESVLTQRALQKLEEPTNLSTEEEQI